MNIQQALDDAESCGGGIVHVPAGDYRSQGILYIPHGVSLIGAGIGSTIGPVRTKPKAGTIDGRVHFVSLEGFGIAGDGSNNPTGYIGIDFRKTSCSQVKRVYATGVKTGLLLTEASYFNTIDLLFTDASIDGIELYEGANQNTFINCKPSAPIGFNIINSNGNTIIGGSGEGATPGKFIKLSGNCAGTCVKGFRGETLSWGPAWCNADNLVGNF